MVGTRVPDRRMEDWAGEEGFEPSHAGIKIRCLNQLGDSPTVRSGRHRDCSPLTCAGTTAQSSACSAGSDCSTPVESPFAKRMPRPVTEPPKPRPLVPPGRQLADDLEAQVRCFAPAGTDTHPTRSSGPTQRRCRHCGPPAQALERFGHPGVPRQDNRLQVVPTTETRPISRKTAILIGVVLRVNSGAEKIPAVATATPGATTTNTRGGSGTGRNRSPMPVAYAVVTKHEDRHVGAQPERQRCEAARGQCSPHSRFRPSSTVAASELPPPRPPPIGMRLSRDMRRRAAAAGGASLRAARTVRSSSGATPARGDAFDLSSHRSRCRCSCRDRSISWNTVSSRW
jgi:hypothetical protein